MLFLFIRSRLTPSPTPLSPRLRLLLLAFASVYVMCYVLLFLCSPSHTCPHHMLTRHVFFPCSSSHMLTSRVHVICHCRRVSRGGDVSCARKAWVLGRTVTAQPAHPLEGTDWFCLRMSTRRSVSTSFPNAQGCHDHCTYLGKFPHRNPSHLTPNWHPSTLNPLHSSRPVFEAGRGKY